MPALPCRIREQVITRKGKKYCRKKRSCHCKAIYNNIRQLTRMLLQHNPTKTKLPNQPRNLPTVPKRPNIPVPPKAPVPKSSKKPSPKGYNALLKELKKKIKQIN